MMFSPCQPCCGTICCTGITPPFQKLYGIFYAQDNSFGFTQYLDPPVSPIGSPCLGVDDVQFTALYNKGHSNWTGLVDFVKCNPQATGNTVRLECVKNKGGFLKLHMFLNGYDLNTFDVLGTPPSDILHDHMGSCHCYQYSLTQNAISSNPSLSPILSGCPNQTFNNNNQSMVVISPSSVSHGMMCRKNNCYITNRDDIAVWGGDSTVGQSGLCINVLNANSGLMYTVPLNYNTLREYWIGGGSNPNVRCGQRGSVVIQYDSSKSGCYQGLLQYNENSAYYATGFGGPTITAYPSSVGMVATGNCNCYDPTSYLYSSIGNTYVSPWGVKTFTRSSSTGICPVTPCCPLASSVYVYYDIDMWTAYNIPFLPPSTFASLTPPALAGQLFYNPNGPAWSGTYAIFGSGALSVLGYATGVLSCDPLNADWIYKENGVQSRWQFYPNGAVGNDVNNDFFCNPFRKVTTSIVKVAPPLGSYTYNPPYRFQDNADPWTPCRSGMPQTLYVTLTSSGCPEVNGTFPVQYQGGVYQVPFGGFGYQPLWIGNATYKTRGDDGGSCCGASGIIAGYNISVRCLYSTTCTSQPSCTNMIVSCYGPNSPFTCAPDGGSFLASCTDTSSFYGKGTLSMGGSFFCGGGIFHCVCSCNSSIIAEVSS